MMFSYIFLKEKTILKKKQMDKKADKRKKQ